MSHQHGNGPIEWGTPDHIYNTLNELYDFNLDPCALNGEIAKCENYFTPEEDGLKQMWALPPYDVPYDEWAEMDWRSGRVFLNPPYGRQLKTWMDKAAQELRVGNAEVVVVLMPASIGTKWFHEIVYPHISEIIMVRHRISFIDLDGTKNSSAANHDSIILELRDKGNPNPSIKRIDAKTGEWIN